MGPTRPCDSWGKAFPLPSMSQGSMSILFPTLQSRFYGWGSLLLFTEYVGEFARSVPCQEMSTGNLLICFIGESLGWDGFSVHLIHHEAADHENSRQRLLEPLRTLRAVTSRLTSLPFRVAGMAATNAAESGTTGPSASQGQFNVQTERIASGPEANSEKHFARQHLSILVLSELAIQDNCLPSSPKDSACELRCNLLSSWDKAWGHPLTPPKRVGTWEVWLAVTSTNIRTGKTLDEKSY